MQSFEGERRNGRLKKQERTMNDCLEGDEQREKER